MLLSDLIEQCQDDTEMLTNVLKLLDATVKYIHSQGYYIRNFDPNKIILVNKTPNLNQFQGLISRIDYDPRKDININIYQMAKIGLMAYNHFKIDGNMNQEHFNFIIEKLKLFNQNGQIPDYIYEYYEELFLNRHVDYLTNYLDKKAANLESGRSSSIRKSLATEAGRALSASGIQFNSMNDDKAFVNILFIPSIIALLYIIGLFIYTFILK